MVALPPAPYAHFWIMELELEAFSCETNMGVSQELPYSCSLQLFNLIRQLGSDLEGFQPTKRGCERNDLAGLPGGACSGRPRQVDESMLQ